MFDFNLNTRVKFGCGSRHAIVEVVASEQWTRLGLVIDNNLLKLSIIEELLDQIKQQSDLCVTGMCEISEPTYDSLEALRSRFSDPTLQAIIGIGGGSALDMAKAMAVLVHNKKPAIEYRGFDKMTEPVLPIIAVPTTAGTGSEVTPNASFVDTKEKKKLGINGEAVRPRYALLDPELTISCPGEPTLSAGVDSMVHAVEAFVAKKTNVLARFFAKEGFKRVFESLPRLTDDLNNIDLRQDVMYGAFLSGIALMHSGTGPAAAMSYPLGVHYQVPHGIGGGIFLPHVVEHNVRHGYVDYAQMHNQESINDFLEMLWKVWEQLNVPKNLNSCGLGLSDIDSFTTETMELKGALDQNPVPFGESEIRATLLKLVQT